MGQRRGVHPDEWAGRAPRAGRQGSCDSDAGRTLGAGGGQRHGEGQGGCATQCIPSKLQHGAEPVPHRRHQARRLAQEVLQTVPGGDVGARSGVQGGAAGGAHEHVGDRGRELGGGVRQLASPAEAAAAGEARARAHSHQRHPLPTTRAPDSRDVLATSTSRNPIGCCRGGCGQSASGGGETGVGGGGCLHKSGLERRQEDGATSNCGGGL
mmetsp:Transcript_34073/g.64194  ORF Transcript_34073/g.64194 Transcript_34073/m.64194 type:complete len:211 (+) Transcript_34073:443-1075(+)